MIGILEYSFSAGYGFYLISLHLSLTAHAHRRVVRSVPIGYTLFGTHTLQNAL